jgi:hypothetical protein
MKSKWPCQQLLGGTGSAIYSNVEGLCDHTECKPEMLSIRGAQWLDFSNKVYHHIETYTVPQYGDAGDDLATNYTPESCAGQIAKYVKRVGRNQRRGQDKMDMIKIAHYAQMAYRLLDENEQA